MKRIRKKKANLLTGAGTAHFSGLNSDVPFAERLPSLGVGGGEEQGGQGPCPAGWERLRDACSPHPSSVLNYVVGTSLAVQWLRLHASNAGRADLIPGQGTKIPSTLQSKIKEI